MLSEMIPNFLHFLHIHDYTKTTKTNTRYNHLLSYKEARIGNHPKDRLRI